MIAKIRKGASFAGLGRYLYGPGRNEEHVRPRVVASDAVLVDDTRGWRPWVADMNWYATHRPGITRPVWHCSLRAAPEDPTLPDTTWAAIAHNHIEAMGLADHPWVAVRHGDNHIHIVACRVNERGAVWSDWRDYPRAMKSVRAIETRHRLTAWAPTRTPGRLATTSIGERERAARRGVEPERAQLREAMHAAAQAARGRLHTGWEAELAARGVLFHATRTSTGRITGYRVSLPGWADKDREQVWLKASQVDRRLSWPKLRNLLGIDHAERLQAARTTTRQIPRIHQITRTAGTARSPVSRPVVRDPQPCTNHDRSR